MYSVVSSLNMLSLVDFLILISMLLGAHHYADMGAIYINFCCDFFLILLLSDERYCYRVKEQYEIIVSMKLLKY